MRADEALRELASRTPIRQTFPIRLNATMTWVIREVPVMSEHVRMGFFLVGSALTVVVFGIVLGLVYRLLARRSSTP
jgi:hypothetical protein